MFDIYLPVVALAPALIYFVPEGISASTATLIGGTIFAATLVGRPLGALIFGQFADTIGRKRTTIIAVTGFGVMSVALAVLPGYETWGIFAVILFILIRFVDGIFVGGEYTAASPLAMEYCPQEKRGLYGALIMTGFPLAFVFISLITFLMLSLVPAGGLDSPYVQWGWRIPFLFGALLAFAFVAYFYFFVDESELFEASGGSDESPLKTLFSGQDLKNFIQVFVLMSGFWLTLNMVSAVLPGLLGSELGLSGTSTSVVLIIAYLALTGGYVAAGVISQRVGRRPFLIWIGIAMGTIGTFFYYLLISLAPQNVVVAAILTTVIAVVVVSNWGLATTYINERFHTTVRASGFGLGYSLAVIIPSFYAFYQVGLGTIMPSKYTALPLLVIGSALVVIGAAMGPETKDVDFSKEDEIQKEKQKANA
ncbi:MFS transporter [soil metagenome]